LLVRLGGDLESEVGERRQEGDVRS
jgi:hypothetical protein